VHCDLICAESAIKSQPAHQPQLIIV